jgi:hypothetical protein
LGMDDSVGAKVPQHASERANRAGWVVRHKAPIQG